MLTGIAGVGPGGQFTASTDYCRSNRVTLSQFRMRILELLGLFRQYVNPTSYEDNHKLTIQDESVAVPWPSVVLTHYTKLSRILGRIGEGK